MFSIPPIPKKKYYVVAGVFAQHEWYLFDVGNEPHATVRQWVTDPHRAIHFKSEDEAEAIGELVCDMEQFTIESFVVFS